MDKGQQRNSIADNLQIVTWNIRGGLSLKETELVYIFNKRKINVIVLTEAKKKLRGTKQLDEDTIIYSGVTEDKSTASG